MPASTLNRRPSWFSNALSVLRRALRPAPVEASPAAPKLEPIEEVVSRVGREPADAQ